MSQRIVTFCDAHQARNEEVTGRAFDVAIRSSGERFQFVTVDLCEECAKPMTDVIAEVIELGREFDGEAPAPRSTPRSSVGRPPKPKTCPVCGEEFANRGSLRTHASNIHGQSIADIEGSSDAILCQHCGHKFEKPQGLAAHVRSAHPAEYAAAKQAAGE